MKAIDVRGLSLLTREATELANRPKLTSQEEKRYSLLLSQISLLKTGQVTLAELDQEELNAVERKAGLPVTRAAVSTSEERAKARAWQTFLKIVRENRTATETEGSLLSMIGTYSGLGQFAPTEFITEVYGAMAAHDALFDENAVSVMQSTNGRVTQIPTFGDIENVAVVVDESGDTSSSEHLIAAPGQVDSAVYSYRSPLWRLSIEAMQDAEMMGSAVSMFKRFAADRVARGVGRDLANGNGSNKPLGLIPSLIASGVTPITAAGSAKNTGGSEDGTNSIGSQDIANLYYSVNSAYRSQPKAAFFMNDSTRTYLAQIVSKQGVPLVQWQGSDAFIFGKPVRVCPSFPGISAGNVSVVFGDGSYWLTRKVINDDSYVQLVKEAVGLIEKGQMALRMFSRFGGELLYTDAGSPSPFNYLQQHT